MMVRIGNFLFHYRNGIFPLMYALLFIPAPPLLASWELALGIGAAVALLGQSLRAVTIGLEYIIRGGKNRQVYAEKLVTGGIFAHCRNPLYVGNYLILVGVGIASNSLIFVGICLPVFAFVYAAIIAAEEDYLRRKFGEEFDAYCQRVNRIVPRLNGISKTLEGMQFNWRRLITAEYGSTYIWMVAILLVAIKNLWLATRPSVPPQMLWTLCGLLLLVSLAYVTARYLKKSGRLQTQTR